MEASAHGEVDNMVGVSEQMYVCRQGLFSQTQSQYCIGILVHQ